MSIRRIHCPACNATANVPATMTNIKCPSCGHVWNVNQPSAPAASRTHPTDTDEAGNGANAAVFTVVAGAVVLLAIAGILLVLFLPGEDQGAATPDVDAVQSAAPSDPAVASYREVDLPEETRKKIYYDYRRMAKSSIEKKLPVPKDSPVRKSVEGMLRKTADREVTHFALLHNISEEDVMQIVAEGDAKQWPGSKKPAVKPAK